MRRLILIATLLLPIQSWATTYYVATDGNDANNGQGPSSAGAWKTFTKAVGGTGAACGDLIIARNGTYGDTSMGGTSGTSKISISGKTCSASLPLTIQAENQRQAKIADNGTGKAVSIESSSYIIIDGLYARSADNASGTQGYPFIIRGSNHITLKNGVARNVNRYPNSHPIAIEYLSTTGVSPSQILVEDMEVYTFHRHCVEIVRGIEITVRRVYCNPRGGAISGGFGSANGLNRADAAVSMYPCRDCVAENIIADGTTSAMYLVEMNANYSGSVLMSGSKVLGSICYKCNYGNGMYPNSRGAADVNHTPQNILFENIAFPDWGSTSNSMRISDGINVTLRNLTFLGSSAASRGIWTEDLAGTGVSAASNSIAMSNLIVANLVGKTAFLITGFNTWSGSYIYSYNNGTAFNPSLPANWTNTFTTDPGLGTCKVYVPTGAAAKGAGSGGGDIGANVLYRYIDGVLTTTPLWDPTTGAFPHGADDLDGTNNVAGDSLKNIHTRLNVNTGGCSFPAGYGSSGGGGASTVVRGTTATSNLTTTATPLTWGHTISANQDYLTACIGLWSSTLPVGSVSGIDVSGQAMTLLRRQVTSTDQYRAAELWGLTLPTSGSRTITATLTGNISGALGRSIEFDATSGPNTAVGASTAGAATSLSVTAPTNTNERIEDCTVSSKSVTYTHGDNQTGDTDLDHSTQSLKLATSTQNGSDGGVMSNATGGTVLQAKAAVSLIAGTPDPPSSAVLTQTDYIFIYPIGSEAEAPPIRSWLTDANAKNLPITIHANGLVRMRAKITASIATSSPFNVVPACRKNAEGYTHVSDTVGASGVRFYGAGVEASNPQIPASLTPTSNRLCGVSCVPGSVLRDAASTFTVPALTNGESVEIDSVLQLEAPSEAVTIECRYERDNGTALDTYTNTALMTLTPVSAGGSGF